MRFLFELRSPTLSGRLLAAIAAPPLAMAVWGLALSIYMSFASTHFALDTVLSFTFLVTFYGSFIAYFGILLVVLPSSLLLRIIEAERGLAYILFGGIGGFLPVWVLAGTELAAIEMVMILLLAIPGALTAGLWWVLASLPSSSRLTSA